MPQGPPLLRPSPRKRCPQHTRQQTPQGSAAQWITRGREVSLCTTVNPPGETSKTNPTNLTQATQSATNSSSHRSCPLSSDSDSQRTQKPPTQHTSPWRPQRPRPRGEPQVDLGQQSGGEAGAQPPGAQPPTPLSTNLRFFLQTRLQGTCVPPSPGWTDATLLCLPETGSSAHAGPGHPPAGRCRRCPPRRRRSPAPCPGQAQPH